MTKEIRLRWSKILWATLLICLPVTSFKYIPLLGSGTYVRPLAIYPIIFLLPLLLFRLLKKDFKKSFPSHFFILSLFILVILTSSILGGITPPVELGGVSYTDRALRSLLTLAVGICFYLAATYMNQEIDDVKFTVRWLMVGLAINLVWAAIQFIGLNNGYRSELNDIQNLFSIRGLVKNKRVSGFAYEPSWLAGQLVTLYLPWLVASFIHNFRPWKNRILTKLTTPPFIDPTNVLLLSSSIVVLLFTYSRSGLAVALVGLAITYFFAGKKQMAGFWNWFISGFKEINKSSTPLKNLAVRIILVCLVVALLSLAGIFLADKGYIAAFVQANPTSITDYIQKAYLGPRFAYIDAALTAYEQQPIFGVGFGASGFWIYQNMPDWSLAGNPEIALQLSPSTNIFPNPKNIFVRLLAETGILGFSVYLVFLISLNTVALKLIRHQNLTSTKEYNWVGTAGLFGMVTILLLGFSQDSVAMPEIWFIPGILTGFFSNKVDEV